MMLAIFAYLFLAVGLIAAYWFLLRPILRQRAELAAFFNHADMQRATWLTKLKLSLSGLKTVLFAKFVIIAGLILPVMSILEIIDLTSIMPTIKVTESWQIAPTQYVPGILVPLIGWINLWLRNITTTPVGVPSVEQVAALIPDAPAAVVEAKAEEIAEAKAPPSVASGKD